MTAVEQVTAGHRSEKDGSVVHRIRKCIYHVELDSCCKLLFKLAIEC